MEKHRVVSVVRVSTVKQAADDRTGFRRQTQDVDAICLRDGLEIVERFKLEGLSGAHVQHSNRFAEMLSMLSRPDIDGIVFASFDRLYRPEEFDAYQVLVPFQKFGKHLWTDIGKLNPKDPNDRLKIVIWSEMAGMERIRIAHRLGEGKEIKRKQEFADSRTDPLPRGVEYDPDTKTFRYTDDSLRVKEAFERVLKGESLTHVAYDLGWATPTSLRHTLRSHWWVGLKASTHKRVNKKWDRVRDVMTQGKRVPREEPLISKTNLTDTPLVTIGVFDAVQSMLAKRRVTFTQRRSRGNSFLCTGVLFCECGCKMYHREEKRSGKHSYYRCGSNFNGKESCGKALVRASEVDRDVWAQLLIYTQSGKYLEDAIKKVMDESRNEDAELIRKRLQHEIKSAETKIRNINRELEDGPDDDLRNRKRELKTIVEEAKAQLERLKEPDASVSPTTIAKAIRDRFKHHQQLSMEERKALLLDVVKRVVMVGEGDDIGYRFVFRHDGIIDGPSK